MYNQAMDRQRKYILITAAIGIISIFFPWINLSLFGISKSINGFHGWGILVFFAFAAALAIILLTDISAPLPKNYLLLIIACGCIALLSAITAVLTSSGSAVGDIVFARVRTGAGAWIAIATSTGIVAYACIVKSSIYRLKNRFKGLKRSISIPSSTFSRGNVNATDNNSQLKL